MGLLYLYLYLYLLLGVELFGFYTGRFIMYSGITKKSSPTTGLDRPRGYQEVKVPRFRDNSTGWW